MSNYKYPTPQLLLKAICDAIRAKTGSNDKIAHQDIPDELNNIARTEYYEEQIENISSIYTGTNLNFSISNNDIKSIAMYKFCGSGLTTIDLPECTSIGVGAFEGCTSLTTIDLPKCTSIGGSAFKGCTSLTTIDLPKCTSIGIYTFGYCNCLTTINLPKCIQMDMWSFSNCASLISINLPKCIQMDMWSFSNCASLISINLPECSSIEYGAFGSCTSLTTVNLPKCASIRDYAFSNCTNLTTVNLPNCTSIGDSAFNSCTSLTTIILSNNQVVSLDNINAFKNSSITNDTGYIYVPDNLVDSYKSDTKWSTYANRIKPLSELPSNLKEEYGYD